MWAEWKKKEAEYKKKDLGRLEKAKYYK